MELFETAAQPLLQLRHEGRGFDHVIGRHVDVQDRRTELRGQGLGEVLQTVFSQKSDIHRLSTELHGQGLGEVLQTVFSQKSDIRRLSTELRGQGLGEVFKQAMFIATNEHRRSTCGASRPKPDCIDASMS